MCGTNCEGSGAKKDNTVPEIQWFYHYLLKNNTYSGECWRAAYIIRPEYKQ
jgi:hypothetical protein